MIDTTDEKNLSEVRGTSLQGRDKVAVPVKTSQADERIVELGLGSRVIAILEMIASEYSCSVEELVLVREGESEPLTSTVVVDANYPHKRCHHVHRAGKVTVIVYYQSDERSCAFKRGATVEDVLTWAIEAFDIDPSLATELELARHGKEEELPGTEHIGHLAGGHCELALDLVRGDIANGSCS